MFSPVFDSSFTMQSTSSFAEGSFLSPKLTLDMSFNRNPEGRFASDVDPLDQQAPDFVAPVPTFQGILDEIDGLDQVLETWKFPLRTDFARGIIWGPFRHYRGNSYADLFTPEAAIEDLRSYAEHAMFPARPPQPMARRQRIFPILRTPQAAADTVVNSLSSSVASESSSSHSATESHFSTSTQASSSSSTTTSVTTSVKTTSTKASSRPAKKSAAAASSSSRASSSKRRRKTVAPSTRSPRPSRAAAIKARNSFRLQARYLRKPSQPRKPKFVGIDISFPGSRIRLCATSLLKYGDL